MNKIKFTQTIPEVVLTMSENNPGALNIVTNMLAEDPMSLMTMIIPLDDLGIYGSDLYILVNNCCGGDFEILKKVLLAQKLGKISKEDILKQMGNGRGTSFDLSKLA